MNNNHKNSPNNQCVVLQRLVNLQYQKERLHKAIKSTIREVKNGY